MWVRISSTLTGTYLLFEVASILLVNEHKVQVISGAKLLVYVPECWCQVKAAEEQPYRNGFPYAMI